MLQVFWYLNSSQHDHADRLDQSGHGCLHGNEKLGFGDTHE